MLTTALHMFRAALNDRAGISSLEYGVLAAAVIAALTVAMSSFSTDLETAFTTLGTAGRACRARPAPPPSRSGRQ